MEKRNPHVGTSFESYLRQHGTLEATTAGAIKGVIAWQLEQAMAEKSMSKVQMAKAMNTSRSQLDRILDPDNDKIQLDTLIAAAKAVGRELRMELV